MDPEMGMLLSIGMVLPQGRVKDKKLDPEQEEKAVAGLVRRCKINT